MIPSPEQHKAALDAAVLAERERIALALEYEAEVCPCEEDAKVLRSTALLVRANFSYDGAERLEAYLSALPEQTGGRWQPFADAPPLGEFLAYYPRERAGNRIKTMRRIQGGNSVLSTVDGVFAFDIGSKPTLWHPLPAPPAGDAP